jgi:hypothetical protein
VHWVLVYDFATDASRIATMQRATLGDGSYGLNPKPALVGTPDWWGAIYAGALPLTTLEGTIHSVYWGSMGDWPEFELAVDDGSRSRWTRAGDLSRYVEGLRARVSSTRHPWKTPDPMRGEANNVLLRVELEPSDKRSDPRAPGPGGIGLKTR